MARRRNWRDLSPTLDAATAWIDHCLIKDGSVFSPSENIWAPENIEEFRAAFVDNLDESSDSFITKLKRQLSNCSANTKKLASEMLWALSLFPSSIGPKSKREQIIEIWNESGDALPITATINDDILKGIGAGGAAYSTGKWRELIYLIHLAADIKRQKDRHGILKDYDKFLDWIAQVQQQGTRQFRQMLRYFAFPDLVENMASNNDRRKILINMQNRVPAEVNQMSDKELDTALMEIRRKYEEQCPNLIIDFYEAPLRSMWYPDDNQPTLPPTQPPGSAQVDYNIQDMINEGVFLDKPEIEKIIHRLQTKKNLILQGAPGVGKTFVAKKLAYVFIGEKDDSRITAVQFHPSYRAFCKSIFRILNVIFIYNISL